MGFEVRPGKLRTFDKEELKELRPESTRAIEITDFVALDEIDPIYYERTYWLAPDGDAAKKAYRPAARGDGRSAPGRHRQRRDARQAVPRRGPPARRRAGDVDDAVRRRGRAAQRTSTRCPTRGASRKPRRCAWRRSCIDGLDRRVGSRSATTTPTPRSCASASRRRSKGKQVVASDEEPRRGRGDRPHGGAAKPASTRRRAASERRGRVVRPSSAEPYISPARPRTRLRRHASGPLARKSA